MASWCCITSSGANRFCPMGSWSGCCARTGLAASRPSKANKLASAQRYRALAFMIISPCEAPGTEVPEIGTGLKKRKRQVSACCAEFRSLEFSGTRRWARAIPRAFARPPSRVRERAVRFANATSAREQRRPRSWPRLPPGPTSANAARALRSQRFPPRPARAHENPAKARPPASPRAAAHPAVPAGYAAPPTLQRRRRTSANAPAVQEPPLASTPPAATGPSTLCNRFSSHHFQQHLPRSVQPGAHRPGRDSQYHSNVVGIHIFNNRQLQYLAKFVRQARNLIPQTRHQQALLRILRFVNGLARPSGVPGVIANQPPPYPALAVERQAEGDAIHPGAKPVGLPKRREFLVRLQKRLLRHILGIRAVPQNAIGDVKYAALVFRHAGAKARLALRLIRSRDQVIHAFPRLPKHANCCLLQHCRSFPVPVNTIRPAV